MPDSKVHWENVYATKASNTVSWYRPHLEVSLSLIKRVAAQNSYIIDIGAGASTLIDDLLAAGFQKLTALDISEAALNQSKKRLGDAAKSVQWIAADVTTDSVPAHTYDVWHDRAVFHFLVQKEQRTAYIRNVLHSLKKGGHIIISTFASNGPIKCSGLDVVRYDAESLHREFGPQFNLLVSREEVHETPSGITQNFVYCLLQKI